MSNWISGSKEWWVIKTLRQTYRGYMALPYFMSYALGDFLSILLWQPALSQSGALASEPLRGTMTGAAFSTISHQ